MVVQAVNQKARERGSQGSREVDAAPAPSDPHICFKTATPPPKRPGVQRSQVPLPKLGSFIKAFFPYSSWEDLNELSS